jgi:Zn-finger nucleic acid-binding protein
MLILEHEQVEVDFCNSCGGIWLDAGELQLLFGDRQLSGDYLNGGDPSHAKGEKQHRCPICGMRMAKEVTRGEVPVVYDACPKGHGLWYDKGELERVLREGSDQPGSEQVRAWLGGLFGSE